MYITFALQNTVNLGVNLLDNIMLGVYSEVAISAATAVNQIQFVLQQVTVAFCECLVMFGSQYWGQRRTAPIKKFAAIGMVFCVLFGMFFFIFTGLIPEGIMGVFTNNPRIIEAGVSYLGIVRYSYIFFTITMMLLALLKSVEIIKIGFYLSLLTLGINGILNYLLIYGHWGWPECGIEGAALATLVSRAIETLVLVLFMWKKEKRIRIKLRDFWSFDKELLMDYIKVVMPMLTISALWGVSTALQTVILGHMGTTAIAANSVSSVLFLVVKGGAQSAAYASSIIIGKTIGTGERELVRVYSRRLQKLFFFLGIGGGMVLFLLRIPVLSLYDLADETREMANSFLIVLSIIYIGMAYQMPTSEGIIRGGGSPVFVMKLNLISSWLIVLPLSIAMAFVIKVSPVLVVACLHSDQLFKCIPVFIKVNFGKWICELTRKKESL
ncbi:MATE family efflux transporter [Ohessyouella blattaphilus]|uniref:MATE family efflux transporter n=1 Tax=Ohessyouella blattaphilus TaxID=2949333 RepID=UPI003EC11F75